MTERTVSYAFDAAGNRTNMTQDSGLGTQDTTYTVNALNQYTDVTAPTNLLTVTGYVEPGPRSNKWHASVANARGQQSAVSSQNGTFATPNVPVSTGANALTVTVTDVSANIATQVVNFTLSTAIGYESNGNHNGGWAMSYDRENRLVQASSQSSVISTTRWGG